MISLIDEKLVGYAEMHSTAEPEILKVLNRDTCANVIMPQMLSGHLQGSFLSFLTSVSRSKSILEVGTYTGYSAIAMALALPEEGRLDTIDCNDELQTMVNSYIKKAGLENKIHAHWGDALKIIPNLPGPFDLVFIDADKSNYSNYFDLVIDKVTTGGMIIADNVLWSGKVLNRENIDEDTQALQDYNQKIQKDNRVENLLLPLRDGLMIARKK